MIHEWRTYTLERSLRDDYLRLAGGRGLEIRGDRCGRLLAFWHAASGCLDQVHHLWEYESLDARQRQRALLMRDPDWTEDFLALVLPAIRAQAVTLLEPHAPLDRTDGGTPFWEKHVHSCRPGRAGSVAAGRLLHGRPGLGLWSAISPDPNAVITVSPYHAGSPPEDAKELTDVVSTDVTLLSSAPFSPLRSHSEVHR